MPDFHENFMQQNFATYKCLISLRLEIGCKKDRYCSCVILIEGGFKFQVQRVNDDAGS